MKLMNIHVAGVKTSRFIEPHDCEAIPTWCVKYKHAVDFVKAMPPLDVPRRIYAIVSGRFIFGDFIEGLIVENNWDCKRVIISTLSVSQENIDSLQNLLEGGYVQKLEMIVSHYYFATERGNLIPYIYKNLDVDDKFQLAVASVHTKICMIETECGKKITIHGSANLRSSDNIEQFVIENDNSVFDFNDEIHSAIIEKHKTINKAVRGEALWQAVQTVAGKSQAQAKTPRPKLENLNVLSRKIRN